MADNLLIHDSADRVPPQPAGRHPLTPISGAEFERPSGRKPLQVWIILTAVIAVILLYLLIVLDGAMRDLFLRYPWAGDLLLIYLLSVGVLGLAGLAITAAARAWLGVQHRRVVRTRHGVPVDVVQQLQYDPVMLEQQTINLEARRAPYLLHPNLSTLSNNHPAPAELGAEVDSPAEPEPIPAETWIGWVDEVPHVMLAAETGAGKTTTAMHIVAPRIAAKEPIYIIDPHAGDWAGVPSVGGGENWQIVAAALRAVIDEYQDRQQERAEYRAMHGRECPIDYFPRLTVVLDEAFLVRSALDVGGRGSVWRQFVPVLGSGARKVRISLVLLTQSANVEDLGISGQLRENYTRIGLDISTCRKLLRDEESNPARRAALSARLVGVSYPAVIERHGQCEILDRSTLAATPSIAQPALWAPGYRAAEAAARGSAEPSVAAIDQVRRAQAQGLTREQARARGIQFDNDLWAAVSSAAKREA